MKNLKLITLALVISISTLSFASPTNNGDPKNELREQIIKLLGDFEATFKSNELVAEVVFTLNMNSELVIISVNSENESVDTYVKSKLNYKKIKVETINEGKIYYLPLTIIKK
jgi:hypothetical protein